MSKNASSTDFQHQFLESKAGKPSKQNNMANYLNAKKTYYEL